MTSGSENQRRAAESEYLDLLFEDSLQQFSDYYETDGQEDLDILRSSDRHDSAQAILSFKDYTKLNTDSRVINFF